MLSRFHRILECDGQPERLTDRQTDRIAISISHVSVLMRDKSELSDFPDYARKYTQTISDATATSFR